MKSKTLAVVISSFVLVLAFGLAACGGSSSGGAASSEDAQAKAEAEAQAKAEAEAQAALEEGIGYWYGTAASGYDKEKARAAFQKAADGGNAEGWYWLGVLRENDTDAERQAQVADFYQKAADAGCAKGWCGLGYLYKTGWGVEKDAEKAKELYEKAIDADELRGYIGLGGLYEKGEVVEASGAKAAELYEKAAASEEWATRNSGRCALGNLYRHGAEGLEKDSAKATEWYQKAANENYRNAWQALALIAVDGVEESDEAAYAKKFEYNSKAADLGMKYNFAICYEYGWGCEKDYAKEIELLNQEAEGGPDAEAALKALGLLAHYGWGMEKNDDLAIDWANKALAAAGPGDDYITEWVDELRGQIANGS